VPWHIYARKMLRRKLQREREKIRKGRMKERARDRGDKYDANNEFTSHDR